MVSKQLDILTAWKVGCGAQPQWRRKEHTDEVQSTAAIATQIRRDEVYLAFLATERTIQSPRPDLSIRGQLVGYLIKPFD